jgi:hypothetical protein
MRLEHFIFILKSQTGIEADTIFTAYSSFQVTFDFSQTDISIIGENHIV